MANFDYLPEHLKSAVAFAETLKTQKAFGSEGNDIDTYQGFKRRLEGELKKNNQSSSDQGGFLSFTPVNNSVTDSKLPQQLVFSHYTQFLIIYCGLVNAIHHANANFADEDKKKELANAALDTAIILYYVYYYLLGCKEDAYNLYEDIVELDKLIHPGEVNNDLETSGVHPQTLIPAWMKTIEDERNAEKEQIKNENFFMSCWLSFHLNEAVKYFRTRLFPTYLNLTRLWIVRLNRVSVLLVIYLPHMKAFAFGLGWVIDNFQFGILSIVFYLPRLLINLSLIALHSIDNSNLHEAEKDLDASLRAKIHFQRLFFSILNDFVWFGIDLIVFFTPAPYGMSIIVTLYIFDVINCLLDLYVAREACKGAFSNERMKDNGINLYDKSLWEIVKSYFKNILTGKPRSIITNHNLLSGRSETLTFYKEGMVDYCEEKLRVALLKLGIATILLIGMMPLGIWLTPIPVALGFTFVPVVVNTIAMRMGFFDSPRLNVKRYNMKDTQVYMERGQLIPM